MTETAPQSVYLKDYQPPNWLVDEVHLTFKLHPKHTIVQSRIAFRPNPESTDRSFVLNGEELSLRWARIDGQDWKPHINGDLLTAKVPDAPFIWEAEVEINPAANTVLEGLYMSNGIYCTQCEAEGFRRITYYPDRPDVMAPFTVRIETGEPFKLSNGNLVPGDAQLPVMLSNGNPVASGPGWAEWHDPWPKPAYLFALVAGDLAAHSGQFRTMEGRDVELNIWTHPGKEDRCAFALDALQRSMLWDEEVYGRAYDLDVFNLVAVEDFNAGAMENKGLNIFNASYVLASPETATDADYEWIEAVVAHEYFHNWTGNRITCRDWFQLSLKEGLTVFRDQQFTGDMRSHAVKRIDDAQTMRTRQFREDNGPLAHPVRPESYIEINNFYTTTVYEKGAEVIGMLKRLVGDEAYAKALDLYFERHDGQACTIEDWLAVFEDSTGRDLSQFKLWYSQAGTPRIAVTDNFEDGTYTLHFEQSVPATPGQKTKEPMQIPFALGLLDESGAEVLPTTVIELTQAEQSFSFPCTAKPVPSLLRGFSAPVIVSRETTQDERLLLLAHDTDPFNRWEASRQLAKEQLIGMLTEDSAPSSAYLGALKRVLTDDALDPVFRGLALQMPSEDDMAQTLADAGRTPDPTRIYETGQALLKTIATSAQPEFAALYDTMRVPGPYSPDAASAGQRELRLCALGYLSRIEGADRARALFASADNMTESLAALSVLVRLGQADDELTAFYDRWQNDATVLDKWFSLQIGRATPDRALKVAQKLVQHDRFEITTPNRFRSVMGAFIGNTAAFHDPTGAGYTFVADWLIRLDPINPRTAARMAVAFDTLARYDGDRQGMMRDAVERMRNRPGVSKDLGEITARILAG
ncbi:MAG: aminopeptidase N [Silicimonas sp.]|nr:aminopeptidase N [Silicimonas sp.]